MYLFRKIIGMTNRVCSNTTDIADAMRDICDAVMQSKSLQDLSTQCATNTEKFNKSINEFTAVADMICELEDHVDQLEQLNDEDEFELWNWERTLDSDAMARNGTPELSPSEWQTNEKEEQASPAHQLEKEKEEQASAGPARSSFQMRGRSHCQSAETHCLSGLLSQINYQ